MIAASSSSGGRSSEPPAHSAPSDRANACPSASPGFVKAKMRAALPARHLAEDMRGGAEAVEADPLRVARDSVRAIPDQPGAEERRRLRVREAVREREAESLVGDRLLGEAAVDVVAGEPRPVTEVLAAARAVTATAARPGEPWNADPLPRARTASPPPRSS